MSAVPIYDFMLEHNRMMEATLMVINYIWEKTGVKFPIYNVGSLSMCSHEKNSDLDIAVIPLEDKDMNYMINLLESSLKPRKIKQIYGMTLMKLQINEYNVDIQFRSPVEVWYLVDGGFSAHMNFNINTYNETLKEKKEVAESGDNELMKNFKRKYYAMYMRCPLYPMDKTLPKDVKDPQMTWTSCLELIALMTELICLQYQKYMIAIYKDISSINTRDIMTKRSQIAIKYNKMMCC